MREATAPRSATIVADDRGFVTPFMERRRIAI
jgi:hypothetical protein